MPGLALGIGAQVRGGGGYSAATGGAPPATTAQGAAYGTQNAPAARTAALSPSSPAGLAFWIGILGGIALLGIYYSLPA